MQEIRYKFGEMSLIKRKIDVKGNSKCDNQMRSIVDVGYSEPVLTGNAEELRKLGIKIKFGTDINVGRRRWVDED